jgi:hypothetical protein
MQLVYLACPYTSPSVEARRNRVMLADMFAARLMRHHAVFSPISQGPRIEPHLRTKDAKSHKFWMDQCIPFLRNSTACYVLPIEGWRESKGVSEEIALAIQMRMPVIIIQAHDLDIELIDAEELRATGWRVEWLEAEGFKGARK